MHWKLALRAGLVGLAVCMATTTGTLRDARAEVSFKGETITMIIGYRPGGGTDAVGRLLGEYLVKYLPGKPDIVFRNMPGGGGITSMNYFARQVKPDGLTITAGSSTQPDPTRFRRPSAHYDPAKFRYIGGVSRGSTVLIIGKDAVKRINDPKAKPVIMGGVDGTRSGMQMALWGHEYLGWNLKWVIGYPGTAELTLALQRGEIDMTSTANLFLIKELTEAGSHVLLAQSGTLQEGKLVPRAEFPDVMVFPNEVRPKIRDERAKKAFDYWEGINALDKWMALPEGTPDPILATYRTAFRKAAKDEEFIARGKKAISEEFSAVMPEDMERLITQVATTPTSALGYINELKKKQGLPTEIKKEKLTYKTISATLKDVKRGGRILYFDVDGKQNTTRVSSSKTEVKIGGKSDVRGNLKPGMKCKINYPGTGKTAKEVACN